MHGAFLVAWVWFSGLFIVSERGKIKAIVKGLIGSDSLSQAFFELVASRALDQDSMAGTLRYLQTDGAHVPKGFAEGMPGMKGGSVQEQKSRISFQKLFALERILMQYDRLRQSVWLTLGNAFQRFLAKPEKPKSTRAYHCCAEIVFLLSPKDVEGARYIRVGKDHDGGYVMVDDFERKIEAAYSLGVGDDVSWDEAIAERGIDVYLYDHTIKQLPREHPKFHYFKTGVTGCQKGQGLKPLEALIRGNGHPAFGNLILKMDVEGSEWNILKTLSSDVIGWFSQLIVEFHGLHRALDDASGYEVVEMLQKLNLTHQSVHVHGNNFSEARWVGDLVLPDVLEVTYVRRADFKDRLVQNKRQFPTVLDQPNDASLPDIYLGSFGSF
jgi:hypothetical protein